MFSRVVLKRMSAAFIALNLILIVALFMPLASVSAGSINQTLSFTYAASSYTGTISMPTKSFSISENCEWISARRSSENKFIISVSNNNDKARSATVKIYNGGTVFVFNVYQASGLYRVTFDCTDWIICTSRFSYTTIPDEPLYRDGYIFLYWASTPDGRFEKYLPGDSYPSLPSKLYSIWCVDPNDGVADAFRNLSSTYKLP